MVHSESVDRLSRQSALGIRPFLRAMLPSLLPVAWLIEHQSVTAGGVAITFDDGYRDNYTLAFPILKRYQVPATFFICPALVESRSGYWWDDIYELFRNTKEGTLNLDHVLGKTIKGVITGHDRLSLMTKADKLHVAQQTVDRFKDLDQHALSKSISALREELGISGGSNESPSALLSWAEVREMSEHGMEFGSHTMSHPQLTRLRTSEVRAELAASMAMLSEQLNQPVHGFAYPTGDYNESVQALVRSAGYAYACTMRHGFVEPRSDLYALRRVPLPDAGIPVSLRDLLLIWQKEHRV